MATFDKKHAEHYMEMLPNVNGWGIFHLLEYFKENNLVPDKKVMDRLEALFIETKNQNLNL